MVIATNGHVRDLPNKRFGLKIENEAIIPQYSVSRDNLALKKIKEYAKKAEKIFIATDEDREGEAIGFHVATILKQKIDEVPRITFHEITKKAILQALDQPRKIDMNLVNAQQTRRILDRIVGYKLSPLLASKIRKGLSAGRVQSSALKIIIDREREIKAFIPQEYWKLTTFFKSKLEATLIEFENNKIEKLSIKNQEMAQKIEDVVKSEDFSITKIDDKVREVKSPPPFMTATLQQAASTNLGFSPKKTMLLAQKLYEGVELPDGKKSGLITYMRTDSLNISEEASKSAIEFIENKYGKEFVKDGIKKHKSKSKNAQEAHEAIRPTLLEITPDEVEKFLDPSMHKLYKLIYYRFLASQTSNAKFKYQNIIVAGKKSKFKISGRKTLFEGFYVFTKILENKTFNSERDTILPEMKVGQKMYLELFKKEQKFTEPPHRYSEAGLVKKMEALGIGRPSTYAPTITILQNRRYIEIENSKLKPTEIAFTVIEILEKYFSDIVDETFTANMEKTLDVIAEKGGDWQKILLDFYYPFMEKVEKGKKDIPSLKKVEVLDRTCPKCGKNLAIRDGRFGEFISCLGFPDCKYLETIDGVPKKEPVVTSEKCILCEKPLLLKEGKNGEFLACSGYPKCRYTRQVNPNYLDISCPECGKRVIAFTHVKTPYYRCEDYPKCKFSVKFRPTKDKTCPKCGYRLAERVFKGQNILECLKCKFKIEN